MLVRCPACEAKFESTFRDSRCPHRMIEPDRPSGTGWCYLHQMWDCVLEHEPHGTLWSI